MPQNPSGAADRTVEHATCLGCGCACDDITVAARGDRITAVRHACGLGVAWFGDGILPARMRVRGRDTSDVLDAVLAMAERLRTARHPLVYLAAEMSCEAQGAALAIADMLGASCDSISSTTVGATILAAQRRGRATATLGEVRNRADVVLFWGVDPAERYPRFTTRYAPDAAGLFLPLGRRSRAVIAVDVGTDRGIADANVRLAFAADEEVDALALIQAAVAGHARPGAPSDSLEGRAAALAERLWSASYLAIVNDGEPRPGRDARRSEALCVLAQVLNARTRCALTTLRAGGNRSGADSVATWQTGAPMALDFGSGAPVFDPLADAASLLAAGDIDVALIAGAPGSIPEPLRRALGSAAITRLAIGPRASEAPYASDVIIDTGVAGIHERGTAVRMDDMPLPLRPALEHPAVARFYDSQRPSAVAAATRALVVGNRGTEARARSPEIAAADALAAAGHPQPTHIVLRLLATALTTSDESAGQHGSASS